MLSGSSGTSQYRINNEIVSSQHYENVLKGENIIIKARNFLVFQGDIEAIAFQSSYDLSRLLEQVSGSAQYKAEYERLKEVQEATAELSSLTFNKKRNYNAEIRQYKLQANDMEKFNQMISQRDEAFSEQALWKLYHLEKSKKNIENELISLNEEANTQAEEVERLQEDSLSAREDYAKANMVVQKNEQRLKKQERFLSEKNKSLLPVDQKIIITESTLEKNIQQVVRLQKEQDAQSEMVTKIEADLSLIEEERQSFEKQVEQQIKSTGFDLSESDINEYENLKAEFAQATSNRQSEIDSYTRQLKIAKEKTNVLDSKHSSLKTREGELSSDVAELESQLTNKSETLDKINTQLSELNQKQATFIDERKRRKAREESLQSKIQEVTDYLIKYNAYTKENEREAKLREDIETMKRSHPGIKGLVHDLCRPKQHKYETAVATVLGKNFNSVIVDTFRTAKECIEYMKEQRSGVASFIPLDSVVVSPINTDLRGISDQVRLAVDTVNYDPELESAIKYVCGNTIICDDINVAKYVRWEKGVNVKAVTLEGAVIHRAGLMTGGRVENQNKLQWNEAEISRAKKKKEQYMNELTELARSKYNNQEEEVLAEIESLQLKKNLLTEELRSGQSTREGREQELKATLRQLKVVDKELQTARSNLSQLKLDFSNVEHDIQTIENNIFSDFAARIGVSSIREYQEAQESLMSQSSHKRLAFAKAISTNKSRLAVYNSKREDLQRRIKILNTTITRDRDLVDQFQQERNVLKEQIQEIEEDIEAIKLTLQDSMRKAEQLMGVVNDKNQLLVSAQRQQDSLRKRTIVLQEDSYKVNMGFVKTLQYCEMESIDIPLRSGSLEMLRSNGNSSQDFEGGELQDSQNISMDAREILNQIVIDYSDLPDRLKENDNEQTGEDLENRIQTLTSNLEKMVVNTRASEHLGNAQQKLTEVETDFEQTREEAKRAKEQFEHVKQKRHELFSRAFNHISKKIDKIYKELTRTPAFPMGGSASLSLADEDEPYLDGVNYNAMPPMKRFTSMELLSGGEKTMAALALLFAINSFHPSPFFVLDEVDAALDNANVRNITRYIQSHAGPGLQFIVISLKNGLFENSQSLVGIYRDQDLNSSRALTMDLRMYDDDEKPREDVLATEAVEVA